MTGRTPGSQCRDEVLARYLISSCALRQVPVDEHVQNRYSFKPCLNGATQTSCSTLEFETHCHATLQVSKLVQTPSRKCLGQVASSMPPSVMNHEASFAGTHNMSISSTSSTGLTFLTILPACGRTRSANLTRHKRGEALQRRETGVVRKLG